jgi:hypothetical protein
VRILLVDADPTVRQGIRKILADVFPNPMFGEAATAGQARELARRVRWDAVVGTSPSDLEEIEGLPSLFASLDRPEELVAAIRIIGEAANRPDDPFEDEQPTEPLGRLPEQER